jgi:predicted helicase
VLRPSQFRLLTRDFLAERLAKRIEQFAEDYNAELNRRLKKERSASLNEFLRTDQVRGSETLKRHLADGVQVHFSNRKIRSSMYRPFCRMSLYYDDLLNDRPGAFAHYFPTKTKELENRLLTVNRSPEARFVFFVAIPFPPRTFVVDLVHLPTVFQPAPMQKTAESGTTT